MSDPTELKTAAIAALKRGDRAACVRALTALSEDHGAEKLAWKSFARLADTLAAADLTARFSALALAASARDMPAQLEHIALLARNGRSRGALAHAETVQRLAPTDPSINHILGVLLAQWGRQEEALAALRRALQGNPVSGPTWLTLAKLTRIKPGHPDFAALEAMRKRLPQLGDEDRAQLHYASGTAWHDGGDYQRAFADFSAGAAIQRRLHPFDRAAEVSFADQLIAGMPAGAPALQPSRCDSRRPIFVTGLPRSGTTLLEQILTTHAEVSDGGETNLIRHAMSPMGSPTPANALRYDAAVPDAWSSAAETYLDMLRARFGPDGRIVDKSLNQSRFLGLVHHALPNAPLIWVRRNPADCAISCFRNYFQQGMPWSWSLEDVAHFFQVEDRLYAYWAATLGDALLTVEYETLIREPVATIDRVLAHCGLPAQDGLERFFETDRAVSTASLAQVRDPLHTGSIGAAERYGDAMAPFDAAYRS